MSELFGPQNFAFFQYSNQESVLFFLRMSVCIKASHCFDLSYSVALKAVIRFRARGHTPVVFAKKD